MRMEVSAAGRARMGAEGAGQHDDLVMAMALGMNEFKRVRII